MNKFFTIKFSFNLFFQKLIHFFRFQGGTAIVGPGGIALTHPRSLAIAGPGARIVAVPEDVDLEQLALRSNARQLPIEGVLVATGPAIYYNPPTTT